MRDDALLDAAVTEAQAEAVRRHRLLGEPVVIWRDGRVVEESALANYAASSARNPD